MGISKPKDEYKEQEKKKKKIEKREEKPKQKAEPKTVIRIADADLDGEKTVINAIRKIKGICHTMAKAVCVAAEIPPTRKLKDLNKNELEKLENVIKDPIGFGIPSFLVNRRKDRETGKDLHLTGSAVKVAEKFDIQRYIELKTYRGWRHMLGQPVRGQRTKSHFRERGRVVGVMKKAVKLQTAKKEKK